MANTITTMGQLFYEPKAAFETLKDNPRGWIPLLTIIVLSAAMMYWYFATVDFNWMVQNMLSANPKLDDAARATMEKAMSRNTMMWMTLAGVVIGTPVALALSALYMLIASKFIGSDISFGKWMSFSAWTSMIKLIGLPLMAVQILTSHGQLAMEQLNMLSLNFLLFHLPTAHKWAGFVTSLDVTMIWSAIVTVIGLRVWTGRSTGTCVTIALIPLAVIYGLWACKLVFFG